MEMVGSCFGLEQGVERIRGYTWNYVNTWKKDDLRMMSETMWAWVPRPPSNWCWRNQKAPDAIAGHESSSKGGGNGCCLGRLSRIGSLKSLDFPMNGFVFRIFPKGFILQQKWDLVSRSTSVLHLLAVRGTTGLWHAIRWSNMANVREASLEVEERNSHLGSSLAR